MMMLTRLIFAIFAMAVVVICSNILVNFPVHGQIGTLVLADLLTYGAFTYPVAFLITDICNRIFGPGRTRVVVLVGFIIAVICSIVVPPILFQNGLMPFELSPARLVRIAVASGSAFLMAQLLDVKIFDVMRARAWWQAPLASSVFGSVFDTTLFFTLAFASSFALLGIGDDFASEQAGFLGLFEAEVPRWVSWAVGDLIVKLGVALALLVPYAGLVRIMPIAARDKV